MTPDDLTFTISVPMIAGSIVAAVIPVVLWCISIQRMVKELLAMHKHPEESAATQASHKLVQELHTANAQLHVQASSVVEANTRAISQLSHFIQWFAKESTGRDAPPYIRLGGAP